MKMTPHAVLIDSQNHESIRSLFEDWKWALRMHQESPSSLRILKLLELRTQRLHDIVTGSSGRFDVGPTTPVSLINEWPLPEIGATWTPPPFVGQGAYSPIESDSSPDGQVRLSEPHTRAAIAGDLPHEKYQRLWQDLVVPALAHGTSIKLRALTDNNLTEVLWDLAHLPVDPISVMLELDDSTNVNFPVGGRSFRPTQPLGEIVSMSLISARHQDMDAITVGSLLLNIDTQIDLRLDALTLQIKNDITGFLRSVSEQDRLRSTHTELHIHQTGLAAAIVGLWLAVVDMGQECPAIVPRFFRGFDDSGIPQFNSGRRW